MSEEIQEMQRQIVNAVQQELTRFSGDVATNLAQLREEMAAEAAGRTQLEQQVQALAGALEQSQAANVTVSDRTPATPRSSPQRVQLGHEAAS